jgi:hypothetical protein
MAKPFRRSYSARRVCFKRKSLACRDLVQFKTLGSRPVTFLRFHGPDKYVVHIDGGGELSPAMNRATYSRSITLRERATV